MNFSPLDGASIPGTNGDDTLTSYSAGDTLNGFSGNDVLIGGAGDTFIGGTDTDWAAIDMRGLESGIILDTADITGGGAFSFGQVVTSVSGLEGLVILMTAISDQVTVDAATTFVYGAGGHDQLIGGGADDLLAGGTGSDVITGGAGDDVLSAFRDGVNVAGMPYFTFADVDEGGDFDVLNGGDGADMLYGSVSNGKMVGGAGADLIFDSGGADRISGGAGAGDDFLTYQYCGSGVSIDLGLGVALKGSGGGADKIRLIEDLAGSTHDDLLIGDAGENRIYGNLGSDTLRGGGGADTLFGGGGGDGDTYAFVSITDSFPGGGEDLLATFTAGDTIDVSAIDANVAVRGDQAFVMVSSFTHAAGQARLSYSAGQDRTYLTLDINGDAVADFSLRIAGDFRSFSDFVL